MVKIYKRKYNDSTYLYVDIAHKGERTRKSLNIVLEKGKTAENKTKLELAEKIRLEIERKIIAGEYDVHLNPSLEFIPYFEKQIQLNPGYTRRIAVINHIKKFSPELKFSQITHDYWDQLKQYLETEAEYKPYSIFTSFCILRAILNKAVQEHVIQKNPLSGYKEKRPKTMREYITKDEVEKLHNTPCKNENVKRAFLFSCFTGLRLSDIISLKYKDIEDDQVKIYQQKTKDPVKIPISQQARKYIPERKKNEHIFEMPCKSVMSAIIFEWVSAAQIKKHITFHCARHTFATLSITYGVDYFVLSNLLGHGDIKTTMIYAKVIDDKRIDAVNKLPTFD